MKTGFFLALPALFLFSFFFLVLMFGCLDVLSMVAFLVFHFEQ